MPPEAEGEGSSVPEAKPAEGQKQETARTEGQQQPSQAAASIPPEVLAKIQADILKEAEKIATSKGQELLGAQRDRILRALGGDDEGGIDQKEVLKALLSNPVGMLTTVAERTRDITKKELFDELSSHREAEHEERAIAKELLGDRPDIRESEESIEILNLYYDRTDPKKSKKERMTEAIRRHDLVMEKVGAGKKEERIKRVQRETSSVPGAGGGSKGTARAGKEDFYDRQKEALEKYKEERTAQFKATHRGRPVASH